MEEPRQGRSVRLGPEEVEALGAALLAAHQRTAPGTRLTRSQRSEILGVSPRTVDRMLAGEPVDRASVVHAFAAVGLKYGGARSGRRAPTPPPALPSEAASPGGPGPEPASAATEDPTAQAPALPLPSPEPRRAIGFRRSAFAALAVVVVVVGYLAANRPPTGLDVAGLGARAERRALNEGLRLVQAGRYDDADALFQRALASARRAGDDVLESEVLRALADLTAIRGDYDLAVQRLREAIAARRAPGAGDGPPELLAALGEALLRADKLDDATDALAKAMRGYREAGQLDQIAGIQADLGTIALRQRRFDRADAWLQAAETYFAAAGRLAELMDVRSRQAGLRLAQGRPEAALPLLVASLQFWEGRNDVRWRAKTHLDLAQVRAALGDREGAREDFARSRTLFQQLGDQVALVRVRALSTQAGLP